MKPHKCPVCDGAGHLLRPPYVPGDALVWAATGTPTHPCRPCNGSGVVWESERADTLWTPADEAQADRDPEPTDPRAA